MKSLLISLALLASACASTPPADDPSGYRYVAEELAPHVHLLRQREPFHVQPRGNVLVIEQSAGVVLIDSGGSPAGAAEVIAFVRGQTRKPVTAIVLTHWHGDHVLGAATLLQQWPDAHLISTAPTRDHLAAPSADNFMPGADPAANARLQENLSGAVAYLQHEAADAALTEGERASFANAAREMSDYAAQMAQTERVTPTETFADVLLLDDPQTPVELRFLGRANTDGDAAAWLPRQGVIASGDIVVGPIPYGYGSYPSDWLRALRQLRGQYRVLAPGHGPALRDDAYIDQLIALIEAGRAQITTLMAQGLSDDDIRARFDLSAERARFVGADPWRARWFDAYWTQAFLGSALKEARGQPIVQGE